MVGNYCCESVWHGRTVCVPPDLPFVYDSSTVQQQQQQYNRCTLYFVLLYNCCCILLCAHSEAPAHPDAFARASTSTVRAAGERRFSLVCTHAHIPTARSGAETAQGGAPAIPTLIGSDKNRHTYNADNNSNNQAAPGMAVLRCTYIARPPSLARRRSYWLYTAVPELIHILYRRICTWYTTTVGAGVFAVYIHRSPSVARPPSLPRRRSCLLCTAAVVPAGINCCNVPGR